MRIYELTPIDGRASFYGKAKVIESENGDMTLLSYNTEVCKVTADGEVKRLWSGESQTTTRHFNAFMDFCGINKQGLAEWRKLSF